MPIKEEEFLTSAENLITRSDEVDFRNAASRAYYSAFHAAKTLIDRHIVSSSFAGANITHAQLILDLENDGNQQIQVIGSLLRKCRSERVKADYRLKMSFIKNRAITTIGLVKQIQQIISTNFPQ